MINVPEWIIKRLFCRLLFTQYKSTWLVRLRLCRLVFIVKVLFGLLSDFKAIFAVASFRKLIGSVF